MHSLSEKKRQDDDGSLFHHECKQARSVGLSVYTVRVCVCVDASRRLRSKRLVFHWTAQHFMGAWLITMKTLRNTVTTQCNTTLHYAQHITTPELCNTCMYESINRHAAVWMKMMTRYRLIDRSTCLLDQSVFCCSLRSEMQTWTHTPANDGVRSIDCQTHWLTDTRYRRYRRTIEQSKES